MPTSGSPLSQRHLVIPWSRFWTISKGRPQPSSYQLATSIWRSGSPAPLKLDFLRGWTFAGADSTVWRAVRDLAVAAHGL